MKTRNLFTRLTSGRLGRSLTRPSGVLLAGLALWLTAFSLAQATTITVNRLADDSSATTLRAALASAANGDTINITVNGTILLTNGELVVTNSVSILGPGPNLLAINGNAADRVFYISSNIVVTIAGLTITNGNAAASSPADIGGGIYIDVSALTVSNCTVSGNSALDGGGIYNDAEDGTASLTIFSSTVSGNLATNEGGGIFNTGFGGTNSLTISNTSLSGNSASEGGGIYNEGYFGAGTAWIVNSTLSGNTAASGRGGGIDNDGGIRGTASLTILDSTLSGNSATNGSGGGIFNDGDQGTASLTISNSTLSGNSTTNGNGGGIFNDGDGGTGTVWIVNTTLSGNSARRGNGGGIESDGDQGIASLTILNSTLSGNSADTDGGGIENDGDLGTTSVTILNSTLSGNMAEDEGGGIYNEDDAGVASLMIVNSTIVSNIAGNPVIVDDSGGGIVNVGLRATATIGSSIVALNNANPGPDVLGSFTSQGFNLIGQTNGATGWIASDLIGSTAAPLNPLLGPLQDNGGPTFTHLPLGGSPAIDKGTNYTGALYDQRGVGFARTINDPSVPNAPGGDGTDIGAVEVQIGTTPPPADCGITANPGLTICAGGTTILTAANGKKSYYWQGPERNGSTVRTIVVGTAGLYTCTTVDYYGPTNTCSVTVAVNPLPNCFISGGPYAAPSAPATLCGPPGMAHYVWLSGPQFAGAVSQCITVTVAGTYSLRITDTNGCQATCYTTLINNVPQPCFITGNLSICKGSKSILTAPNGMISYDWTGPSGFASSAQFIVVATGGVYTVTQVDGHHRTNTCSATLVVNDPPSCDGIKGARICCAGGSTTLCGPTGLLRQYWLGPQNNGLNTVCNTVSTPGSYTLVMTDSNGCQRACTVQVWMKNCD